MRLTDRGTQTDRQTDGRTDRILIARAARPRTMQRGKNYSFFIVDLHYHQFSSIIIISFQRHHIVIILMIMLQYDEPIPPIAPRPPVPRRAVSRLTYLLLAIYDKFRVHYFLQH